MPGDVAASKVSDHSAHAFTAAALPVMRPADADLDKLAKMIEGAKQGGDFWRRRLPRRARRGVAAASDHA